MRRLCATVRPRLSPLLDKRAHHSEVAGPTSSPVDYFEYRDCWVLAPAIDDCVCSFSSCAS